MKLPEENNSDKSDSITKRSDEFYMKNREKNRVLFWISIQIALSAAGIILSKHAFNLGVEPLSFSYRILFTSVIYLCVYALIRNPGAITKVDWRSLIVVAFIGIIFGGSAYGLGYRGLQKSTAINYAFLIQTSVFYTPVLAFFFLRERLKPLKVLVIFGLLFGAYLVSTKGNVLVPRPGDILILLSSFFYSFGVIITKITLKRISAVTMAIYRALFGGLSLFIFVSIFNRTSSDLNLFWVATTALTLAGGILAMNKVLECSAASYMQMMYMSVPVVAAICACFFLGETITIIQIIGGTIVIVLGVVVHLMKNRLEK